MSAFTEAQLVVLRESAISDDVAARAGVFSVDEPKRAAKLLGLSAKQWDEHLPVIVFPYRIPFHRDPVVFRGKPAKPFEFQNGDKLELRKYVQPKNSGVHVYFGPSLLDGRALKDASVPLWITEGERKCLSAESAGLHCLAVPGVTQWHAKGETKLHPYFAHVALEGREVFLAFDRDSMSNEKVRKQELAFGRALEAVGATVRVVRFPEDAPKLDDFLARHERSELDALIADARANGKLPPAPGTAGAPAPGTGTTDLANSERFVEQHREDVRYCDQIGRWYMWDGRAWRLEEKGQIQRRAMRTARSIYAQADALSNDDERMAMRTWAAKSESRERLAAMVSLAGSFKSIASGVDDFDADGWALNVENGIVNLKSGKLEAHDRSALCTRYAPTHYDPNAIDERWLDFLEHISSGNAEVLDFLQRAAGYSLTGDTREDKLFFVYGPPGRGKSSFVGALEACLGEYARTADISTFLAQPNAGGDRPRPDLVRLAGARVVCCKEVDAGVRLAEGLVKTITGGDTITVRTLHRAPFEMRPSFKLWIVANDPPVVRGDDAGMWRRMVRVPFERGIDKPDPTFRAALREDPKLRSAVLAWAVRGVRAWLERGLESPEAIAASTADYRAEMDPTGEWLDTFVVFDAEARIARKELRSAYEQWCKEEGHQAVGARRLAAALRERARGAGLDEHNLETSARVDGRVVDAWRGARLARETEVEARRRWSRRERRGRSETTSTLGVLAAVPNMHVESAGQKNPNPVTTATTVTTNFINTEKKKEKEVETSVETKTAVVSGEEVWRL